MSFIYIYIFGAPFIFFFYLYLLARRFCASLPDERTNDDLRWFRLRRRERERANAMPKVRHSGTPGPSVGVCVRKTLLWSLFLLSISSFFPPFHPHDDDDKSCSIPCYNKALADCSEAGCVCLLSPGWLSIPSLSLCVAQRKKKRKKGV
jgi:hypothetical protein